MHWFIRALAGLLLFAACNAPDPAPTPVLTRTLTPATPIPETTANPTEWSLVTVAPEDSIPFPTPVCGQNAPPTRIIVGEHGMVLDDDLRPLNVRAAPGTDNRILGRLQVREVFMVLDGPQCSGEYVWYRIKRGDLEGWIAEGDFALYYIGPYLPG